MRRLKEMAATGRKLAAVWVLALAACDAGDVVLLAPEAASGAPTLSVRAVLDTPYAALATSLGWTAGVPGAQVRVHLMTEPYDSSYWHQATADSTGLARFTGLLAGLYEVELFRWLTAAEALRGGGDVRVLAGGGRLNLPAAGVAAVTLAPDQRGALLFSEFGLVHPDVGGWEYPDAMYFEVYNNSDTTIYLDGKYWGIGWRFNQDFQGRPCDQSAPVRNDPEGIWTDRILRFPGAGRDYPLEPGRTALIAKSAIDHRAVQADLYDLSHADFEWGGWRNADNPDVPNLQDIGQRPILLNQPRWRDPEFLSEPVDLDALPRYVVPDNGHTWVRIPRAAILDVWVGAQDWTTSSYRPPVPTCLEATHRSFDRLPGPAFTNPDFAQGISYQRRVLTVLPDGRQRLQDTNTSMFDFVKALRTPGWIPDP